MLFLSDLLQSLLIEDDIRILIQISGTPVASGNWFQDQILDYSDHHVRRFSIDFLKNKATIDVDGDLEL